MSSLPIFIQRGLVDCDSQTGAAGQLQETILHRFERFARNPGAHLPILIGGWTRQLLDEEVRQTRREIQRRGSRDRPAIVEGSDCDVVGLSKRGNTPEKFERSSRYLGTPF